MSSPVSKLFQSIFAILFACSAIPAFAQHGGGGHGGGGGGFHGGGGGAPHMSGGGGGGSRGGSYSAPAAGYAGPRSAGPSGMRPSGGYGARPGSNYAGGNQRYGNSSAPSAAANGQWHSFGSTNGGRGAAGAQSEAGAPSYGGGFHVFSGNRAAGSTGSVRSFSGEGHEVWENAPAARNMVPKSQSLSTLHNSIGGSLAANSRLHSNARLSASSRLAGGSPLAGSRGFSGRVNASNSPLPLRGSGRFGIPHGGIRGGCWNCGRGFGGWGNRWGYGFGGGWGLGWGGLGLWGWDPFLFDPWWGWPAEGYGYYGYPGNYLYGYPQGGYYAPDDYSAPPAQQDDQYDQGNQGTSNGNWITPNGPSPSAAQNSANFSVPVLIYMKNGAVYSVRDYWMSDDELNYILMDGAQHTVDLEQVDLPRTNTENAKSGVKFIFKSEPSMAPPPVSAPAPSPTQELNAVPQPEART